MKEMKSLTIGENTYEVVDDAARTNITALESDAIFCVDPDDEDTPIPEEVMLYISDDGAGNVTIRTA